MMPDSTAAAAWLFGTEPTDRALAGWHDRTWIALGTHAMLAKPYQPMARWLPCGYAMRWFRETSPAAAGRRRRPAPSPPGLACLRATWRRRGPRG